MLLRDLLVALPGFIGPVGTTARAQEAPYDTVVGERPAQIVNRDSAGSDSAMVPADPAISGETSDRAPQPSRTGDLPSSATQKPQPSSGDSATLPSNAPISLDSQQTATVVAGRVATLLPDGDHGRIASVRILDEADWGHVSVNPDNSLALVLSGTDQKGLLSFRYEVSYATGQSQEMTAKIKVVDGQQKAGWGIGEHYVLETDADGRSIVEHGENHRKVYVSASPDALSLSDIAKMEGVKLSAVNGKWLAARSEYGSSPEMALDEAAGMALWATINGSKASPSSNWLLLESGHTYDSIKFLVPRGTQGESALNPVLISSYGDGARPVIATSQVYNSPENANIVIRDLAFHEGVKIMQGTNYLLEEIGIRHETLTAKDVDGFTLRNSDILDVFRTVSNSKGIWEPHINRTSGFYANGNDGLLVENNFVDHTGWADNYKANLALSGGQPPSIYSQSMYLSYDNTDLTLRDNVLMRGASFGAQVRSGGVIENNVFLDNNAGINFLGGQDNKTHGTGNYTLFMDNVVTSGAHRDVTAGPRGALTLGVDNSGRMTTMVGNIVAHLSDPNNPRELAQKYVGHDALKKKFEPLYDDTLIYNWVAGRHIERNLSYKEVIGQLDKNVLNETTIQKFAADLLGKGTATIADLANHLRGQANGKLDGQVDADIINAFFREGFGLDTTLRGEAETLRFIPNDLADGIRWDNRLNWSTGDLPGTQDGDSVDLGGNHVQFGGQTVIVDHFDFGDGGRLTATSGKLTIDGEITAGPRGGILETDNAGQVWTEGYRGMAMLDVDVAGGRFVNTGSLSGRLEMTVSDDGQAILASAGGRMILDAQDSLTLVGSRAQAGFDGRAGTAVLKLEQDARLAFVADAQGLSQISEFRSGAFGTGPAVQSGVVLDGILGIDLKAFKKFDPKQDTRWTLVEADEIVGGFDKVQINGLGPRQDALLRIDYDTDTVVLAVSANGKGSGQVRVVTAGDEDFRSPGNQALTSLWNEMHMDL